MGESRGRKTEPTYADLQDNLTDCGKRIEGLESALRAEREARLGAAAVYSDLDSERVAALDGAGGRQDEERNRWIRLFNRLDAAVARHRQDKGSPFPIAFADDADDALHAAHDRILKDAAASPAPCGGAAGGQPK